jgi:hypothetical protein
MAMVWSGNWRNIISRQRATAGDQIRELLQRSTQVYVSGSTQEINAVKYSICVNMNILFLLVLSAILLTDPYLSRIWVRYSLVIQLITKFGIQITLLLHH